MLNKKLVIAALFAAANAQADGGAAGAGGAADAGAGGAAGGAADAGADAGAGGAADAGAGAGGADAGAGGAAAGGADAGGAGAGAADGDKKDGDKSDDDWDFEKARGAWKEVLGDGTTERVLCDQGDSEIWEEAQAKFKALVEEQAALKIKVDAKQAEYDLPAADGGLKALADDAAAAKALHASGNLAYLQAWTDAKKVVDDLTPLAGGSDETSAKELILQPFTAATTAAEVAVATQRGRIEALLTAQRTQDQEAALWAERVTAATTAESDANDAEDVADAAVTEAGKQVTDRSWLFESAKFFATSFYDTGCNASGNAQCMLAESAYTTTTSTWTWPTNCNFSVTVGVVTTVKTCTILGLKKDANTGLVPSATTYQGVATVTGASPVTATGLTDVYEKANYTYDQAGGTTKLATALSTYLAW